MERIINNIPPKQYRETQLNLKRAFDILAVTEAIEKFWPVTARSVYYQLISNPTFKETHWLCHKGKRRGLPLLNPYDDALIPALKWLRLTEQLPDYAINDDERIVTKKTGSEDVAGFVRENTEYLFPYFKQCTASNQERYIEVWTEKNGLVHILKPVADDFCRRVISCKGFQSFPLFKAFKNRAKAAIENNQIPTIIYCGDYDPAGLEIPKVIYATLKYEHDLDVELYRFALTPEHVGSLHPVELKKNDKRVKKYKEITGYDVGWELDAIHPEQIQNELRAVLEHFTDMEIHSLDESVGERVNKKLEAVEAKFCPLIRNACKEQGLIA